MLFKGPSGKGAIGQLTGQAIRQADELTLVITRTTAKALGHAIPPTLVARAHEAIE
jgi:hypothetical protein